MQNSEKGISLLITFFIMIIVLSVILSISVILYSEIKVIRNMGDSVVAFYTAASGVEKILYYDRKVIPEGATGSKRGVCYMCKPAEPGDTSHIIDPDCKSIIAPAEDPTGCDSKTCENCKISFNNTTLSGRKNYSITATVAPMIDPINPKIKFSELSIDSVGAYKHSTLSDTVKRAFHLDVRRDETKDLPPTVNGLINYKTQGADAQIYIWANIGTNGHGVKSVTAHVYNIDNSYNQNVSLYNRDIPPSASGADGVYSITLTNLSEGVYTVDITAFDNLGNSFTQTNVPGVPNPSQ